MFKKSLNNKKHINNKKCLSLFKLTLYSKKECEDRTEYRVLGIKIKKKKCKALNCK